jgi:pimeloyl-ACP methyl ester carboxylesterase
MQPVCQQSDVRSALVRLAVLAAVATTGLLADAGSLVAEGVILKNNFYIEGRPFEVQAVSTSVPANAGQVINRPVMMIDAGMRRYYVPVQKVANVLNDNGLGAPDLFDLRLPRRPAGRVVASIGPLHNVTPFDSDGRRQVTLNTTRGPEVIDQGIFEVGPKFMRVSALKYDWEFGVATRSIPPSAVDAMIRKVTDQTKPEDRFAIVRFFLQAELFLQALAELDAIANDFPDLKARVDEFSTQARQQLAQKLLDEFNERRNNGQHFLAWSKAKQFPVEGMSAAILRQVREFLAEYETAIEDGEKAIALLGELQGQIEDGEVRTRLEAMRSEVAEKLNYETLARLRPFLQQADDSTRPPNEKLALAYSGWVSGDAAAIDSLPLAMNLWQARFKTLRYIRSNDTAERTQILADLLGLEGVGAESVLRLIPFLPPLIGTPEAKAGHAAEIEVDKNMAGVPPSAPSVKYHVLLPTEYSHDHTFPMVVALHAVERNPAWELRWWGGTAEEPLQAQRRGYIVIAPEYLDEKATTYTYSPQSHYRVQMALRDAFKRFNIDSNRVFLAGHGSGGDAAFDIGNAHPDLFAGVIPITGQLQNLTIKIWRNGRQIPWYIVSGQLDRDVFEKNASLINRMMIAHYDVLLSEFIGRGYESFYEEIHQLFDWMDLQERSPDPAEFSMNTVRPNNNRFFWLKANTLENVGQRGGQEQPFPTVNLASRAKIISGEILAGSINNTTIAIKSPARSNTIWLSPDMIDFDIRLKVRVNGRSVFNDFVESSVEHILDDLRLRGDRQRVYHTRIDLN